MMPGMNDPHNQPALPIRQEVPETSRPPEVLAGAAGQAAAFLPTARWIAEGLRTAFFIPPKVAGCAPAPPQVFIIALVVFALEIALSRLGIAGPARFDVQAWLSDWWTLLVFIGLAWWAFKAPGEQAAARSFPDSGAGDRPKDMHPTGVAACFVLWLSAYLPMSLLYQGLMGLIAHGWLKAGVLSLPWFYWALYAAYMAWALSVTAFLIVRFTGRTWRAAAFFLAMVACTALSAWQFNARVWQEDYSRNAAAVADKPRLHLSQQTFETQQALLESTLAAIAPERPGVADVYALVFAPYAAEDVFMRESRMVSQVLAERFDAGGRVIHLLNNGSTTATHPWATTPNLQRAIDALGQRMDRDNDVLVVYLTSHGARDFRLAASHWPLQVEALSPAELRAALDKAGIRHRVIAVSACYSGGWVDVLANDDTLVMTAADATHTSYGCGALSELTFFGRAVFDEQLRKTHSFEKAFARAVPLIQQREIDAGKDDGFSNPQIKVGAGINTTLKALEARLGALPVSALRTQAN